MSGTYLAKTMDADVTIAHIGRHNGQYVIRWHVWGQRPIELYGLDIYPLALAFKRAVVNPVLTYAKDVDHILESEWEAMR